MEWSFMSIWNGVLDRPEMRTTEPRARLWASELYKPDVDIYLKLKGEQPTNVPNARSLRKFQAGNVWEYILKLVLLRSGILKTTQERIEYAHEGCLPVSGKIDFFAGGEIDYAQAEKTIEDLKDEELPFLYETGLALVRAFKEKYPNGLVEKVIECKSVSVFAFNRIESTGKALPGHDLQAFHYAYGKQKEATLVYVCRDDCRIIEIPLMPNDKKLLERYKAKVSRVTSFHAESVEPPKEPLVLFDEDLCKFSKNLGVEYSSYLTKLYGFKEPAEYDEATKGKVMRWNRVIGRIKRNEKMTENNLEALNEMGTEGFNVESIKNLAKTKSAVDETDEEE